MSLGDGEAHLSGIDIDEPKASSFDDSSIGRAVGGEVGGELRLTNGIRQVADVKCFICHGGSDMQLFRLKSKFFEILETGRESEA